jgi:ergothioneine biosynthesis protein EgtB
MERPTGLFSPIGWHLGHVAATWARWLQLPLLSPAQLRFFDPFQTANKDDRTHLPAEVTLLGWLQAAEEAAVERLEHGPPPWAGEARALGLPEHYLFTFLIEHQLQHAEHVAVIGALLQGQHLQASAPAPGSVQIPAGRHQQGAPCWRSPADNEGPPFWVELPAFQLERGLVTGGSYAQFITEGGYRDQRLWSEAGWGWRCGEGAEAPRGWDGTALEQPVQGVSFYEAEAFCRWAGGRLPTEAEWEAAAHLGEAQGELWEWTSTPFQPYPGFRPYPYEGYSRPWFGERHRVVRGGSRATAPALRRPSFRNWYEPHLRELPIGFRCARGAS